MTRPYRWEGYGDVIFGVLGVTMLGLSTAIWSTGVSRVPTYVPVPRTAFLVVNGLATLVLVAALVVRVLVTRTPRRVVLTAAAGVAAVLVWLVVTFVASLQDTTEGLFTLSLFTGLWVLLFALFLTRAGVREAVRPVPDGAGSR